MKIFFQQGHSYIGGASKPFFVPLDAIAAGATGMGFTNVQILSRSDVANLPFRPPTDDWNTLGLGTWSQQSGELELPDQVRWIFDMTVQEDAPNVVAGVRREEVPHAAKLGPPAWLVALLAIGGLTVAGYAVSRV